MGVVRAFAQELSRRRLKPDVVEHVLGSNQYFVDGEVDNFTEQLIAKLKAENFLISENFFTKPTDEGLVKKSAVFDADELRKTINTCKKHASEEWENVERPAVS